MHPRTHRPVAVHRRNRPESTLFRMPMTVREPEQDIREPGTIQFLRMQGDEVWLRCKRWSDPGQDILGWVEQLCWDRVWEVQLFQRDGSSRSCPSHGWGRTENGTTEAPVASEDGGVVMRTPDLDPDPRHRSVKGNVIFPSPDSRNDPMTPVKPMTSAQDRRTRAKPRLEMASQPPESSGQHPFRRTNPELMVRGGKKGRDGTVRPWDASGRGK